jgi:hypothetical protein
MDAVDRKDRQDDLGKPEYRSITWPGRAGKFGPGGASGLQGLLKVKPLFANLQSLDDPT